jgi:hypothetical protein
VVEAACWSIGRMGPDAGDKAVAALTDLSEAKEFPNKDFPNLLKDADEAAKKAAGEYLRQTAKEALDAIKKPKK